MKTKFSLIIIVLLISALVTSCTAAPTAAPEATKVPATEVPATQAPKPAEPTKAEVPPTEVPKPPAPEYIEFGASIPLTGNFGSLGNMVLPGYEFAVEAINATGGVYVEEYGVKIPIRLTYYDDESDPTKAVS